MKNRILLLSLTLFAGMLFTACGPASETERTPDASEPAMTNDDFLTEPMTTTQEATLEMTEPAMTETVSMTATATASVMTETLPAMTEVVPPTGFVDASRLTNLMDFPVYNQNGEQIGEVGDMILNAQTQEVEYVILELGGFLGLGEAQVPVPWTALSVRAESRELLEDNDNNATGNLDDVQNAFVLLVDQEVAENAPDFDMDILNNFCGTVAGWDIDLRPYWATWMPAEMDDNGTPDAQQTATGTPAVIGTPISSTPVATDTTAANTPVASTPVVSTPAPGGMNLQGVILASDLLGADIKIQDNQEEVGTVDDVMIDLDTGKVRFIVITFNLDDIESRIPLPVALLGCDTGDETFVVLMDTDTVRGAPTFTDNEFPDTRSPDWDVDFLDYWDDFVDLDGDMNTP